MGDNKDLLDEIDKLEDNDEVVKEKEEKASSHEKVFSIVIIVIIIIALGMLYIFYKGAYTQTHSEGKKQKDFSVCLDNFMDHANDEDTRDDNWNLDEEDDEDYGNYEELEKQALEKFETQKPNLTIINQSLNIDNELIAVIHNGNQERVSDVLVQVIFYNAENAPIKIDEEYIDMDANADSYITFYKTPKEYARCEFLISKDFYIDEPYISCKNDVSFETKDVENQIEIKGKNNSDKEMDYIEFEVVYYNENNQIIDVEEMSEYEVKPNSEFELVFDRNLYKYENYEEVPVARYEVILKDAITVEEN